MAFLLIAVMLATNLLTAFAADENPDLKSKNPYTLTIGITGEGTAEVNGEGVAQTESGTYAIDAGAKVMISANAEEGYEVSEILLDEDPVSNHEFIMPEKDAALAITFIEQEVEKSEEKENLNQKENLSDEVKEIEIQKKRQEIKASYFPSTKFRSARKTIYLNVGREIYYNGYSTNFFEIEGNGAWCLEPSSPTPGNGYYNTQDLDNQSDLAKAMYYSVSAPGESALYEWFGSEGYWQAEDVWSGNPVASYDLRFAYCHMFLSWVYSNFDFNVAFHGTTIPYQDWYESFKTDFYTKLNDIRNLPDPPSGFTAHVVNTGNSSQVMGGFSYVPNGSIELYKKSANPELTDGNSCYSLAGAEYGVYLSGHGDAPVAILTTDENGYAFADNIPPGDYWVKELTPPKGFAKDPNSHHVKINGNNATLNVKDYPQSDPIPILLGKIDAETNLNKPQGSASLENAEFTVKYYGGFYDTDPAAQGVDAIRKWVIKTREDGKTLLSDTFKVSGDDFYYNSRGIVTLPLGTITIQESKAPKGYLLNEEVFVRQITAEGITENVETYNQPKIPETPQKGIIKLKKQSSEADYGTSTLKGAVYQITDSSNKVVDTLTTNEKGEASSKELPLETYYVKETKAPSGFLIDKKTYTVNLTADNKTDRIFYKTVTSTEVPQKGIIELQKNDKETGTNTAQGAGTLKGAVYDIFLKSAYKAGDNENSKSYRGTLTTDEKGKAKSKELPLNKYYVIERKASNGYLVDSQIHEVNLTAENTTDRVFIKNVKSSEEIIRGNVEIIKFKENIDSDNDTLEGLEGVEFTFTSDTTGKVVKKIVTDKYGFATTADPKNPRGGLVFDTYTVTETKCPAGLKPIEPFKVTIKDEGVTLKGIYKEDKLIVSPVSVVKVDAATGKNIALANTEFRLLDTNKKPITMTTYYPNKQEHKTFKTDENGQFTFPEKLKYGTYYLEEVNAPNGYLKGELLEFKVTEGAIWEKPLIVKYSDDLAMGQIVITKTDDKKEKLSGAVFEIRAAEDIVTPDGTERLKKGDLADIVTTGKDGTAKSNKLFLGNYEVIEVKQPDGFILNEESKKVELKYKDQVTELVAEAVTITNKPNKAVIVKIDAETEKPLSGVKFKIWNKSMESDPDSEISQAEEYVTDQDGKIHLQRLVPGTYCIQEIETLPGYVLDEKIHEMKVDKDGKINGEEVGKVIIKNVQTKLLGTSVKDKDTDTQEAIPKKNTTFIDNVKFKNLQVRQEYIIKGKLMDKLTGKPLLINEKEVTAEKTFKPEKADGTVDVEFTFDSSALKGKQIVVFEKVYIEEKEILSHEDINDKGQTITFPDTSIGTSAKDKDTDTQEAIPKKNTTFIDTVKYENLIVGQEYTLKGKLMDKSTKKPLLINEKEVTAEKTFKPEKANGRVDVEFIFDSSALKGKQIVVFEKLYVNGAEVAAHEDLSDKGQTIIFKIGSLTPNLPKHKGHGLMQALKTGDLQSILPVLIGLLGSGTLIIAIIIKKRKDDTKEKEEVTEKEGSNDEK